MVRKDLALAARLRLVTTTVPSFAALMLLLFSFTAGAHGEVLAVMAPGAVWLTVLLCSTLAMHESMRLEAEHGVLSGLLLAGLRPSAIYVGKAAGNVLSLLLLALCMIPLAYALFGLALPATPPAATLARLGLTALCGVLAVAAPGTLLAAMAQGPRRALVVPLLYYPLVVPALLAAVRASACLLAGGPSGEWAAWLSLAVAYNLVYWPLCALLFGQVIEED